MSPAAVGPYVLELQSSATLPGVPLHGLVRVGPHPTALELRNLLVVLQHQDTSFDAQVLAHALTVQPFETRRFEFALTVPVARWDPQHSHRVVLRGQRPQPGPRASTVFSELPPLIPALPSTLASALSAPQRDALAEARVRSFHDGVDTVVFVHAGDSEIPGRILLASVAEAVDLQGALRPGFDHKLVSFLARSPG